MEFFPTQTFSEIVNTRFYRNLQEYDLRHYRRECFLNAARRVLARAKQHVDATLDRPRIPQPHSDNGITGPTC
jgi:hypothetical protein